MSFVETSGVRFYIEETGTGHPVIFLHELMCDCRDWEAQIRFFSRFYRCIAINARGYPPSDVPNDPNLYGYEFAVEDVAGVIRGLGISTAHIVGLSMGAYAALQFGLRYPAMTSAIVAAAVGTGSPPAERDAINAQWEAAATGYLEQGSAAMAEILSQEQNRVQLRRKDPRGFEQFVRHLQEHSPEGMARTIGRYQAKRPSLFDFREQFSRLQVPVLVMVGDEDARCLETSLFLKQTIPNAGLWMSPRAGHAIHLEEPAAFNQAVLDFFGAVERGRWDA